MNAKWLVKLILESVLCSKQLIISAGDGHCLFALPSKERSVCSHTGEGMFRLGFTITTCKVLSSLLDL